MEQQRHELRWEEEEEEQENEGGLRARQSRHSNNGESAPKEAGDKAENGREDAELISTERNTRESAASVQQEGGDKAGNGREDAELISKDNGNHEEENGEEGGFKNSVYFDEIQGTEPTNGVSEMQSDMQKRSPTETSNQHGESIDIGTILGEDIDVIEEDEEDPTDFDVERVLQKQNTHHLYCPNCHSCITRRVILQRRKPKFHHVLRKKKPIVQVSDTANMASNVNPTPAVDELGEGEVFRCLSCLSIFTRAEWRNWFLSLFASGQSKTPIEQAPSISEEGAANTQDSSVANITPVGINIRGPAEDAYSKPHREYPEIAIEQKPNNEEVNGKLATQNGYSPSAAAAVQPLIVAGSLNIAIEEPNDLPVKAVQAPSVKGVAALEPSIDTSEHLNIAIGENDLPVQATRAPFVKGVAALKPSIDPSEQLNIAIEELNDLHVQAAQAPSVKGGADLKPLKVDKYVQLNIAIVNDKPAQAAQVSPVKGDDQITDIEAAQAAASVSQRPKSTDVRKEEASSPLLAPQTAVDEHIAADESREWDILKSIVYGGLVELITSLGVVASAVGAGAATLNILVLGLANLIGGLFIISHNLIELKNEQSRVVTVTGETESEVQEDRYQQILGRREHFPRHVILSILSYLIFGLLPPVVYGFSFRESDNKDYKLLTVAGASLVCIILLAIGKAHVRKPPRTYFKTVLHYVVIGFVASGVSYAAGELLDKLLEKLGLFKSSSAVTMPILETNPLMETAWASY